MNDYKKLIGDIGDLLIAHPSENVSKMYLRKAADAIERLLTDRNTMMVVLNGGERMTPEEAIKVLRVVLDPYDYPFGEKSKCYQYDLEAINKAIEALEKQIPKKPLHMHKNYYCPICKEDGWILWDDAIPNDMDKYCGKCGQAIDWEVDE